MKRSDRRIDVPCVITVEHTHDSLEAHVELEGGLAPNVGDRILVHGSAVAVPFGEKVTIRRPATLVRATALDRLWTRMKSRFLLTELYEISFTAGRL